MSFHKKSARRLLNVATIFRSHIFIRYLLEEFREV